MLGIFREVFGETDDFVIRPFRVFGQFHAAAVYL